MIINIPFLRNFLFASYVIYFSQGVLYARGGILGKVTLITIFLLSFFFLVKLLLIKNKKPVIFWAWTSFLALNVFGFIISFDYQDVEASGMIRSVLLTLISFYPFYYFSIKGWLSSKHLIRFFIIMIPVIVAQFYSAQDQLMEERNRTEVVNNSSYMVLYYLPFIFLLTKNRIFWAASLTVFMFLIVESSKRATLVVAALVVLVFIFYQMRSLGRRQKVVGFLMILVLTSGLVYYLYTILLNNEFLLNRMATILEGNSSGRDVIFQRLLNTWLNGDFFRLLFGFGFATSSSFTGGMVAHNDWMEILINFGLFGAFIFLILFYSFIRYLFESKWGADKRYLLVTIILISFLIGVTSRWYSSLDGYTLSMLMAFLVGSKSNKIE